MGSEQAIVGNSAKRFAPTPADLKAGGIHLAAALGYAGLGWKIVPIQPGTKIPFADKEYERHGEGLKPVIVDGEEKGGIWRATNDPATIRKWWTRWRGAGIAVLCGPAPEGSGIWVLDADVDPEKGKDGFATLSAYAGQGLVLPETASQATGSGRGRQWFFAWPEGQPASLFRNSVQKALGVGLDVRARGGYVVLPPSKHPSGRMYQWRVGESVQDRAPAPAPAWLIDRLEKAAKGDIDAAPGGPPLPVQTVAYDTRSIPNYVRTAVEEEVAIVRAAAPGTQSDTLNRAAFNLGTLVGAGVLPEGYAHQQLVAAGMAMPAHSKKKRSYVDIEKRVTDALRAGARHPRDLTEIGQSQRPPPPSRTPPAPAARKDAAPPQVANDQLAPLARAGLTSGHADMDRAAAAQIWNDCVPLERGVPAGRVYIRRFIGMDGDPLPKFTRLRVGVMQWLHRDRAGKLHDLGRWPCIVAAYGRGPVRGILRIWLEDDGSDQARVADPDSPARALPAHYRIGDTDGHAIHLGAAGEGLSVAVTLECALAVYGQAPGPVWAVDSLSAAARVDVPDGLSRLYLVLWRVWLAKGAARRETDINHAGWHLSAGSKRQLMRVDMPMPALWSPAPGRPRALVEMEADIARWEGEGGQ